MFFNIPAKEKLFLARLTMLIRETNYKLANEFIGWVLGYLTHPPARKILVT